MGNSKISAAIGILTYTILFIFAVKMMTIAKVDAKTCTEGLPWVDIICDGEIVSLPCWNECGNRHGNTAKARCGSSPAFPESESCYCDYDC